MSKSIRLTADVIEMECAKFREALEKMKMYDGKVTYTKDVGKIDGKADLVFTEPAYVKMMSLVNHFDKEVAWHGIVKRGDDETKSEYIVSDIIVYPQEVTGANVVTDQKEYEMWLMNHDNDVFNNIRMQGHSHVNMATSPSAVDTTLYNEILSQLEDDMFYIFLIWNKKGERTVKIYDLAKNIVFENEDINISVIEGDIGLVSFIDDAVKKVKSKVYQYQANGTYGTKNKQPAYQTYYGGTYVSNGVGSESGKGKGKEKKSKKGDNSYVTQDEYDRLYGRYYDDYYNYY